MAGAKKTSPEETKRKILAAAEVELEEVGALELSTRAVARRAGVGVATVHGHFTDRQGLLDAMIDGFYEELAAGAMKLRDEVRGADTAEIVEKAVRRGFRFGRENQSKNRALLLQVAAMGSLDRRRQRSTQLPFLASLASVLAKELGVPEETARLRMQSVLFAIGRWVISSDDELMKLSGRPDDDIDTCLARVEDHLVALALSQLTAC